MKTTTKIIYIASAVSAIACFALSPAAQAQDGDELNGNTAEGGGAMHTYIATASAAFDDTALGDSALFSDTTGSANTATGNRALEFNTTGGNNTANGAFALQTNTTGFDNTATGVSALQNNTTGGNNTATGIQALLSNTTGHENTATGLNALEDNTTGIENTATGADALEFNTTGSDNTATGLGALGRNTIGGSNTANGVIALLVNASGNNNTADGFGALQNNNASNNTADGYEALSSNTGGTQNTATGVNALFKNATGNNNIALGFNAGSNLTTGSNNIDIGANVLGNAGEANTIRIGKQGTQKSTFIAGIFGTPLSGSAVVVSSAGKLGVATSSARFKEQVKPMNDASDVILALKPVTFRYKEDVDPNAAPQFGLVAEEVEKVAPDLVIHDEEGKPFTVRYEAVNAMLLNEFLKEHRKTETLEATLARQQKQIEALTTAMQRVSDRLELDRRGLGVAAKN